MQIINHYFTITFINQQSNLNKMKEKKMSRKQIEAAIKPEFMAKLKQLKIKTRFMNNVMNPQWIDSDHEIYLQKCIKASNWIWFLSHAFQWINTPEGDDFWSNIQDK